MKLQSSLFWYLLFVCGIILTIAEEVSHENNNFHASKDLESEKEMNSTTVYVDEGISKEYYYNRIHTARLEGSTGETVYWVNLFVGSPPQKQTAIIDTGSSLLAFPCEECKSNCGNHLSKKYDLKQSLSSQKMACDAQFGKFKCSKCRADPDNTIKGKSISETGICDWGVSYVEGSSISGFMAVDYVVLGDEMQDFLDQKANQNLPEDTESEYLTYFQHERVQIPFGCTTQETNLFLTQKPDGIIGLGPSSNEFSHPPNIIDQIFSAHLKNGESHVFSLCLNAQAGGFMSIGGYNHEFHESNASTKIINFYPSSGFYDVHLTKITLGDVSIECGGYQPIIDSGTTLVYGPASLMNQLMSTVNKQCNMQEKYLCGKSKNLQSLIQKNFLYKESSEFPTLKSFLDSFPVLLFDFRNNDNTIVTIEWTADGYLYVDPAKNNPNLYQFAFEGYPTGNKVYLSGPFMKNYDILFDKNKQEIHFTKSNCTLPHINSVLMNMHSHKIRQTTEDKKFIDELIKFQKDFNYTQPKFKKENMTQQVNNETKNNDNHQNTTNSNTKDVVDASKDTGLKVHEPSTIQKVLLYGGLLIIIVFALVCCKRTLKPLEVVEEHEEIPLTKVQIPEEKNSKMNFSAVQRNRRLEMIVEDKDEALRSEEDNEFGYKNDASYNGDDSTRRDLEGQFGHLEDEHDEEVEEVDEDNEHKHALEQ